MAIDRGTDTITLDVGVPIAIEERWGGGVLFKYREGRIHNCGIQNLRGESDYDPSVTSDIFTNIDVVNRGDGDAPLKPPGEFNESVSPTLARTLWSTRGEFPEASWLGGLDRSARRITCGARSTAASNVSALPAHSARTGETRLSG